MALEPRLRPFLAIANRLERDPSGMSMQEQRAADVRAMALFGPLFKGRGARVAAIEDHRVPVRSGRIRVRIYRPSTGGSSLPLHVFLHGGGFCVGDVESRDNRCRDIAADVGCVVASVDYRLAPENTYPTPPEDCYQALCWLVEHARELRIDTGRVSIGGESAGGNLAAVACLMARDRGGPALVLQLLDVPVTDLTLDQPSMTTYAEGYGLTRAGMARFIDHYLEDGSQAKEAYASPLHAPDLSGLPAALVTTAECDPLRDEGEAYARRLEEAGVHVESRRLAGSIHVGFAMPRLLASAREHHRVCVTALKQALV